MSYKVYFIGPSLDTQGGISSVLKLYKENLTGLEMAFLGSYSGKNRFRDLYCFIYALIRTFIICLTDKKAIFHINTASNGSYFRKSIIARMCLLFGRKVILHIHGGGFIDFIESSKPQKKKAIITLLRRVHHIIVLSDFWLESYQKYTAKDKISVLYNPCGIIDKVYKPRSNMKTRILFVGAICKNKGVYDLIQSVRPLDKNSYILDLYGNGELDQARSLTKTFALTDNIHIYDWVSRRELDAVYERSDILVLPSYAEGMPMCILEAMGKGLPIIASDVGGIPDTIVDGHNGYIISPGNTSALKDKISLLISDKLLREQMGKASLELAATRYSVEKIAEKLKRIYDSL
ncbi:glycosyltransferase [Pseudobacteroides cellulosolvens]|uniref:Glycosyl transferase group 1 n=1 Tax=Pseudobacteroides cellulosolvens ATCC 35603 = DSM 2933 TaxID=398512 RepID=A0A0L6JLF4_9FIRM|nr:glycosyltransferase [Pseudobacteroides cellulosolvens]KNY26588.1 glycosyl transferase group 1 [Pseudobacteroides cellulosolvens ATCC 35603 = DSM 2933]